MMTGTPASSLRFAGIAPLMTSSRILVNVELGIAGIRGEWDDQAPRHARRQEWLEEHPSWSRGW
jgi:hypothetical protein